MKTLCLLLTTVAAGQSHAAITLGNSPAFRELVREEAKDPAAERKSEGAKAAAAMGFNGERGFQGLTVQTPEVIDEKPAEPKKGGTPTYIFEGSTPIKGVHIYKPKEDPNGDGRTEKPEVTGPVDPKIVYGALGLGLLATIAGIFFPPLLFLGGLALGAGAVLWYINKKFSK